MANILTLANGHGFAILITGNPFSGKTTLGDLLFRILQSETGDSIPMIHAAGIDLRSPVQHLPRQYTNTTFMVGGEGVGSYQKEDLGGEFQRKTFTPIAHFVASGGVAICSVRFPTLRQRRVFAELIPNHLSVYLTNLPLEVWFKRRTKQSEIGASLLAGDEVLTREYQKLLMEYEEPTQIQEIGVTPHLVFNSSEVFIREEILMTIQQLVGSGDGSRHWLVPRVSHVSHRDGAEEATISMQEQKMTPVRLVADTKLADAEPGKMVDWIESVLREHEFETSERKQDAGIVALNNVRLNTTTGRIIINVRRSQIVNELVCYFRCYLSCYPNRDQYPRFWVWLLEQNRHAPPAPFFAVDESDGQLLWCMTINLPQSADNFWKYFLLFMVSIGELWPEVMRRMYTTNIEAEGVKKLFDTLEHLDPPALQSLMHGVDLGSKAQHLVKALLPHLTPEMMKELFQKYIQELTPTHCKTE